MMQKNECKLLRPWIEHHSIIFGLNNIYVYDNGSTDSLCIGILKEYEKKGLNVNWSFHTQNDFENKGNIFSDLIKEFDNSDASYDFYFPLDCDEFISYERKSGDLLLDRKSIEIELAKHIGSQETLFINASYDNNPLYEDYFFRNASQRKCFFYKGTCLTLDRGFHIGESRSSTGQKKTGIVYVHYHFKEFDDYQSSAKQKLLGRVSDFSINSLEKHLDRKGAGYHLIEALLNTENDYYKLCYNRLTTYRNDCYELLFISTFLKGLGLHVMAPENIKATFNNLSEDVKINGVIDSFSINNNSIKLIGWVVSSTQDDVNNISIIFENAKTIRILNIKKYDRPDVVKAIDGAYVNCGVVAEKELTDDELEYFNSIPNNIIASTRDSSSALMFNKKIFDACIN
ncbi:glycosyltransferase family 2 protein [Aeromonas rivipollensis]